MVLFTLSNSLGVVTTRLMVSTSEGLSEHDIHPAILIEEVEGVDLGDQCHVTLITLCTSTCY